MVLDLIAIEEEIESGRAVKVTGTLSAAEDFIVETLHGKVFYKKYQPRDKTKDAAKDASVANAEKFNQAVYSLPATANIDINIPLENKVAAEVMATLRWRSLGLPFQDILHYDGRFTIIFRHLNGYSFDKVLNGAGYTNAFSRVLDSFHNIRRRAIELGNSEVLHSDPYANNFFYDEDKGLVVPFDSSKVNRREMGFEEIDARLNLFFLCKLFHLKVSDDTRASYLAQSVDRLAKNERRLISRLYVDPKEQREYLEAQKLPGENIIDIYYRTDVRYTIQSALTRGI